MTDSVIIARGKVAIMSSLPVNDEELAECIKRMELSDKLVVHIGNKFEDREIKDCILVVEVKEYFRNLKEELVKFGNEMAKVLGGRIQSWTWQADNVCHEMKSKRRRVYYPG